MYKIMLQKYANDMDKFDKVIETPHRSLYHSYMDKPYYFGRLVKIVDGKEEKVASFCNSKYAKPLD